MNELRFFFYSHFENLPPLAFYSNNATAITERGISTVHILPVENLDSKLKSNMYKISSFHFNDLVTTVPRTLSKQF